MPVVANNRIWWLVMQILETAVIVAWSFIAMPKDPKGQPALLQVKPLLFELPSLFC